MKMSVLAAKPDGAPRMAAKSAGRLAKDTDKVEMSRPLLIWEPDKMAMMVPLSVVPAPPISVNVKLGDAAVVSNAMVNCFVTSPIDPESLTTVTPEALAEVAVPLPKVTLKAPPQSGWPQLKSMPVAIRTALFARFIGISATAL